MSKYKKQRDKGLFCKIIKPGNLCLQAWALPCLDLLPFVGYSMYTLCIEDTFYGSSKCRIISWHTIKPF